VQGVAIGIVVIFFTVVFPKGGVNVDWWGNTVYLNTLDANGTSFLVPPPEGFGLATWS
jgi:hypothetical protein